MAVLGGAGAEAIRTTLNAARGGVLRTGGGTVGDARSRWRTLLDRLRSYRIALRASRRYGRSIKLSKHGKLREALEVARDGLAWLNDPVVRRQEAPEGTGVVGLTIQVEWLARQLDEPGACEKDLADSVTFMKGIADTVKGEAAEMIFAWLPYLEARLAQLGSR